MSLEYAFIRVEKYSVYLILYWHLVFISPMLGLVLQICSLTETLHLIQGHCFEIK